MANLGVAVRRLPRLLYATLVLLLISACELESSEALSSEDSTSSVAANIEGGVLSGIYGSAKVGEVISVYDGDTFRANLSCYQRGEVCLPFHPIIGENVPIRVSGIDTPEIRGSCEYEKAMAGEAQQFTEALLVNAEVIELHDLERDKYFRIVATVIIDGENLTQLLLDAGLGYPYEGGTKEDWCG